MICTARSRGFVRVLDILKRAGGRYVSGPSMAAELGISRVAVWKHVRKIRSFGYEVESGRRLGYRLAGGAAGPLPWEILDGLSTRKMGKRIHYFESLDSTQAYALRIAGEKREDGAVVIARRQTAGRGRMGRRWISPHGGVWLSVITRPARGGPNTVLPLAASVALAEAIEAAAGVRPELKWPNDVLVNGGKVAGILVDASVSPGGVDHAVIGVGINLDVKAGEISRRTGRAAASLSDHADAAPAIVREFLSALERATDSLDAGGSAGILSRWTGLSCTVGRNISVETGGGTVRGRALCVDPDGALVLDCNGDRRRVVSGDLVP
ncbi:biotin-(acetyl-CoA carboxylase) ligase [Cenarchaeum symbiosum A]|uniref:Biotin-(Acetyl-CoA carboxylase) ligase n=1 Tax=Cenarchaeum symbiosum (strain A) TaxID=414004 RepID=A0RX93_CENSY|nr:biotin-(acetyl-CoA carboxylase) ligase [Cenarchaeum symbiosum A]